ncbi:hypothetical protein IPG41_03015 [Candidatus Peregrinibacteria bacterium]|nr:MAG: hypothetical protein IPG41_03015 [Candidatus Peregrinibacteria bacterium]
MHACQKILVPVKEFRYNRNTLTPSMKIRALLFLPLLLASCSIFGKLSEVEYNNKIVERMNLVSTTIEESATLYHETVPNPVRENSEIEVTQMNLSYAEASKALDEVENLLLLESRNIEQQNSVQTELKTYQSAASEYLSSYKEMLAYYESGAFKEDLDPVESLDEELHTNYTTFIQANNDFVDVLESHMSSN